MTNGYVAVACDKNGHVDSHHLCDVYQRPDERLQVTAEPVTRYADVQRRRREHLRQPGRQKEQVVDYSHHLHECALYT